MMDRGEQIELVRPPGQKPYIPHLFVVAVTEESALPTHEATPTLLCRFYRQYSERLVCAVFNGPTRMTGSKLLLGGTEDFMLLRNLFARLQVWHIDQQ